MPSRNLTSERPTLPPLHTLDLPIPKTRLNNLNAPYHSRYDQSRPHLHVPYDRQRQVSLSSACTSASRTPSPVPSTSSGYSHPNHRFTTSPSPSPSSSSSTSAQFQFILMPSTLEAADAIVVVPPPTTPFIPTPSCPNPTAGQALLLVGPALDDFRHPNRRIAKGARVHPYRMVRRRSSVSPV